MFVYLNVWTLHTTTHYMNEVTFVKFIFFVNFPYLLFHHMNVQKQFRFQSCTNILFSDFFFVTKYQKLGPLVWLPRFILIFPDVPCYAPILASLQDPSVVILESNRRRRYSQPSPFSPQKDIQYCFPSQIKSSSKSASSYETQYRCTHCDFRCTWKYDLKMHLKKKHGVIVKN